MTRNAMTTQEPVNPGTLQIPVVTGIIRIGHVVEIDGKGG